MANAFQVISRDELKRKLEQGEPVQVINVLEPPPSGRLKLIGGSTNIPLSQLKNRLHEIDKEKEVVVYCADYECQASKNAATELSGLGYNVRAYEGGIKEWAESKLPVE